MQATAIVEIGRTAPDFRLRGPGGQFVTLSEYRGARNVVLVFFPLAFSPVCSHQLPAIEKDLDRIAGRDAQVLGISVDSHYANEAFARHLMISFPLLSDFQREAAAAYGVLDPGTQVARRAIFVVDKQGRLVHREVSPDPQQIPSNASVIRALEALS
jgi:peroxiredoxin (alkyl hydroperoxide reductase subunit C)